MTEAQAHRLIGRWKSSFITGRKEKTEMEIIQQLQLRMIICMTLSLLLGLADFSRVETLGFWHTPEIIFIFLFCFSLWMTLRLWQARRALDKSQIVNPKS
jgi:hypothetical protein